MFTSTATSTSLLDPAELTGRARSHIVELAEPRVNLHRCAVKPFLALRAAAAGAGIDLAVASGFRDFAQQRAIWNGKYRGERAVLDRDGRTVDVRGLEPQQIVRAILCWSALPGASRHHWGTELDVFDQAALAPGQRARLLPEEYAEGGVFARLARWLDSDAEQFGFFRPYDRDRGGVQPEPWHLSFAPIAASALAALSLQALRDALGDAGLEGYAALEPLLPELYERYVLAVASPSVQSRSQAFLK